MNKIQLGVDGISSTPLAIGFEGEQNHTQIVIYWTALYEEYPNAAATMVMRPPLGDAYPRVIQQDENKIIWDVSASDTATAGSGEYQLTFTNSDEIIKTYIGRYMVAPSLSGSGTEPEPVADWIADANEVLAEVEQAIVAIDSKAPKQSPVFTVSMSMGRQSGATVGGGSTAFGVNLVASGAYSHAEGNSTTASGINAHSEGSLSKATGNGSHAEGGNTTASGHNSHAEGSKTTASAQRSHAEGEESTASAINAHAEGYRTEASGEASHAEGHGTTASANNSHAEGSSTGAQGENSHVEGQSSFTTGGNSHAEGTFVYAVGYSSHAEGFGTYAKHKSQHVSGEYNVYDPSSAPSGNRGTYAEIIGNGTSSSSKSNARALDWNGNERLKGDLYVNCNADSTGGKKVAEAVVVQTVTGTTPTITGVDNTRYMCGEVDTISITPPASGIIDVVFSCGSIPAILTIPGTVKFPEWFDSTTLEADRTYEINILDGVYGLVTSWGN